VEAGAAPSAMLNVVAIGGGTGLSMLLRGLKAYVAPADAAAQAAAGGPRIAELTGVVTVTDDGGSSGRLRKELNILPPGDIRNCLVALSEDEALLSRLFQHRFAGEAGLGGHSFGNLFLAALNNITGDFAEAVKRSSEILATRGRIVPCTTANVQLEARMDDGRKVRGETSISASAGRIVRLRLTPATAKPLPETLEAIAQADLITLGPGSLFTSLVPNLLVRGVPGAIARSRAVKVYVCNLMTQANESLGLTAADHVRALAEHAGTQLFDYILVNQRPVSRRLQAKYALEGACQIVCDTPALEALGVRVVGGDFLAEDGLVRHHAGRVARELLRLAAAGRPSKAATA
jgi:uncharacterized cofD-like protein